MILLQIITLIVLIFLVILIYTAAVKLVNEHRELQSKIEDETDQDNLDLTNKQ